jgi:hypothetical protein
VTGRVLPSDLVGSGAAAVLLLALLSTGCGIPAGVTLIERAADPLAARVRVSFRDAALPEVLDDLSDAAGFRSAYVRGAERDVSFTFRSRSTTVRGVLDALCRGRGLRHDTAEGQVLVAYSQPVDDRWEHLPHEGSDIKDVPLEEFVESLRRRRAAVWLDPRAAGRVPHVDVFTTTRRPGWFVLDLVERATGIRCAIVDDTYVLSTPELISTAMLPARERATPIPARRTPGPEAPGCEEVVELLERALALTEDIDRRWPADALRSPESYHEPIHISYRHGADTRYGPDPVRAARILRSAINERGYFFLRGASIVTGKGAQRRRPALMPEDVRLLLVRVFSANAEERRGAREEFESRFGADGLRELVWFKEHAADVGRFRASQAIAYIHPDVALPYVERSLAKVNGLPLHFLGYVRDERSVALLAGLLDRRKRDAESRRRALAAIGILARPHFHRKWYEDMIPWWELDTSQRAGDAFAGAVEVLKRTLEGPDEKLRRAAAHELCRVGGHEELVLPFLERELASDDFDRSYRAAVSLKFVDLDSALPVLARFCQDEDTTISTL